jgi:hypothetical protein
MAKFSVGDFYIENAGAAGGGFVPDLYIQVRLSDRRKRGGFFRRGFVSAAEQGA